MQKKQLREENTFLQKVKQVRQQANAPIATSGCGSSSDDVDAAVIKSIKFNPYMPGSGRGIISTFINTQTSASLWPQQQQSEQTAFEVTHQAVEKQRQKQQTPGLTNSSLPSTDDFESPRTPTSDNVDPPIVPFSQHAMPATKPLFQTSLPTLHPAYSEAELGAQRACVPGKSKTYLRVNGHRQREEVQRGSHSRIFSQYAYLASRYQANANTHAPESEAQWHRRNYGFELQDPDAEFYNNTTSTNNCPVCAGLFPGRLCGCTHETFENVPKGQQKKQAAQERKQATLKRKREEEEGLKLKPLAGADGEMTANALRDVQKSAGKRQRKKTAKVLEME